MKRTTIERVTFFLAGAKLPPISRWESHSTWFRCVLPGTYSFRQPYRIYWAGQKVRSVFSVRCYGEIGTNFFWPTQYMFFYVFPWWWSLSFGSNPYLLTLFKELPTLAPVYLYICTAEPWTLNNAGLNCASPLIPGCFSMVNTTVLHGPWLAEFVDAEKPQIQGALHKL